MVKHTRHPAIAAILALVLCFLGCTSLPPGGEIGGGFTGNPLGVNFYYHAPPVIVPGSDSGWTMPVQAGPATEPATAPATTQP